MSKNINNKLTKLIKYYSLINHNLIFSNKAINRYIQKKVNVQKNKAENVTSGTIKLRNANLDKIDSHYSLN